LSVDTTHQSHHDDDAIHNHLTQYSSQYGKANEDDNDDNNDEYNAAMMKQEAINLRNRGHDDDNDKKLPAKHNMADENVCDNDSCDADDEDDDSIVGNGEYDEDYI
jgi:hypothetical protein